MRTRTRGGYKQRLNASVYEHVLVAEAALGRKLPAGVQIHHGNEDKMDNRSSNLVICQDAAYHKLLHVRTRVLRAGGDPNTERICGMCKELRPFNAFTVSRANKSTGLGSRCRECSSIYNKTYVRPSARQKAVA